MLNLLLDRPGLPLSRRQWIALGGLAGLSNLTTARATDGEAVDIPGFGRAKSVIVIFAGGGQSQLDTWDPKPLAPREIRGEFDAIETSVPGTFVSEHMPRIARLADRFAIVRSMSHEDLDHGSASYLSLTGHYHKRRSSNPPAAADDLPAYSSILKRLRPKADFPEPAIHVNGPLLVPKIVGPGQGGGLLGHDYDPMLVGDVTAARVVLPGLDPLPDLTPIRLDARRSLVEQLDHHAGRLEQFSKMSDVEKLHRRAFDMLARPETRLAFDLAEEPLVLRKRYGLNRSGQGCVLARRLVEAGVPLVTVFFNHSVRGQDTDPDDPNAYGWDTHNDIFSALKDQLLPRFDLAFSALIEDLETRGLLDETLLLCFGEFGRAPRVALEKNFVGTTPGRKHWASVYSIVAAGAGVQPGKIIGGSNAIGAFPVGERFTPGDVIATIFSSLGINPSGHFTDALGRPFTIATGNPIEELYR